MELTDIKGVLCQTVDIYNFSYFMLDLKPLGCQEARGDVKDISATFILATARQKTVLLLGWYGEEQNTPPPNVDWGVWKDCKKKDIIRQVFIAPSPTSFQSLAAAYSNQLIPERK